MIGTILADNVIFDQIIKLFSKYIFEEKNKSDWTLILSEITMSAMTFAKS